MIRSNSLAEITAVIAFCLAVIALAMSVRGWMAQPRIVSVSVKDLLEEERDWLLAQNATETSAAVWIDTVASEIEASLQALESEGYIVVVREAVLAGDVPDLTDTVRESLGVRERLTDPVSRSADTQAAVSDRRGSDAAAPSYGDSLIAEIGKGE
jgi:Tfp pilus assembly PilM family ATPase